MPTIAAVLLSVVGVAMSSRVCLVTGANKGIGKEIARTLGSLPGHVVILACRDVKLGMAAAEELRADGCQCAFTRLDLTNPESIEAARVFVAAEYGRLDALVNNAAICFNDPTLFGKVAHTPFERQASITIQTNFFGTLAVTEAMMPLLRKSSASPRIVNVASSAGRLRGSSEIQEAVTSPSLDVLTLSKLMKGFVAAVEAGTHAKDGWPNTCYGVSKMGLIALTRVLARNEQGSSIMVSSVDPGYCATDQNANQGTISAAQGAVTASLLAHASFGEREKVMSGLHFYDGREIPWSYQ